jgi:hypothetical protein
MASDGTCEREGGGNRSGKAESGRFMASGVCRALLFSKCRRMSVCDGGRALTAMADGSARHCLTYIGPPNGPIQRPKPLGMSNTNAMKQLRGPKHENWPVCDPRAAPPEEYGL